MKHLDGEPCFVELTKVDCALITQYLEMGLEYARAKDLKGVQKDIVSYMTKFRSFYGNVSTEEMLDRR